MPTQTENMIKIPALIIDGREIIPASEVSRETENYNIQPAFVYPIAPQLSVLRHAFFDRNHDGSYMCPEYRDNVLTQKGRGEWTSTYLLNGKKAIIPEIVFYHPTHGWTAEGKEEIVELPRIDGDKNWVTEYDKPTGFPSKLNSKQEAKRVFGEDASRFWYDSNGLRAVCRFYSAADGPFLVGADYVPGGRDGRLGVRLASRQEPLRSKGDEREIVVITSSREYKEILRKSEKYDEICSITKTE